MFDISVSWQIIFSNFKMLSKQIKIFVSDLFGHHFPGVESQMMGTSSLCVKQCRESDLGMVVIRAASGDNVRGRRKDTLTQNNSFSAANEGNPDFLWAPSSLHVFSFICLHFHPTLFVFLFLPPLPNLSPSPPLSGCLSAHPARPTPSQSSTVIALVTLLPPENQQKALLESFWDCLLLNIWWCFLLSVLRWTQSDLKTGFIITWCWMATPEIPSWCHWLMKYFDHCYKIATL